ncbi:MAG: hypothetical protein E7520_04555 [Ruminococcaceae bacterium]|nr:hypothetical protein [Oscillospiraceae bacterium]
MAYFSKETEYFLYVLRCAISGKTPEKPQGDLDWAELMTISKKQEVYAVIAAVLPLEYLPGEIAATLNNYNKSELARLIAMKSELALLETDLEENGIRFMLLKGSRIKAFYPRESMRQMSDIDILYDQTKRDSLIKIMKSHGYTLYSWSENSDDFHKKPVYTFEFHRELFFDEFGFVPDFSFVWDNATVDSDNSCKYVMSDSDLYLHAIAHLYKHYVLGGVGVRFLMDIYLLLKKAKLDTAYIADRIGAMELTDFEKTVRELSLALFDGDELSEEQLAFLEVTVSFGVYGNSHKGRELQYEHFRESHGGSTSMLRYTLSRIFPSSEYMHRTYRVLDKAPYLLPYFYVHRMITKTITDGGRATREIKEINEINKKEQ